MKKYKGKLLFMGWFNLPWKLMTDDSEVDLQPIVNKFFASLKGKRATHNQTSESYTLSADKSSEFQFQYIPDEYIVLKKPKGFGMSNVHAYLENALVWFSGRMVKIEIETGKRIKFMADESEDVFGVYFAGAGNSCEVPSGTEETICKIGQPDCCIFLSITSGGFSCEKFNGPLARMLLDRLAKGNIRASRIGNCKILGRKS